MQWLEKHIATAEKIISSFNGEMPLQHYLKKYFSQNKKHGSKDRKIISHFAYTYFRLGKALPLLAFREKLLVALFLCEHDLQNWKSLFDDDFLALHHPELEKRIEIIQQKFVAFSLKDIFPFEENLGAINKEKFVKSIFAQPNLFLRIRPGKTIKVLSELRERETAFRLINEQTVALSSGEKVQDFLAINKDVVIQDVSSQKVADFFGLIEKKSVHTIWDCCAASGGKTILAHDFFPHAKIICSDVRPSIIYNLQQRLRVAKINVAETFILDLSKENCAHKKFDFIICDAPCSGSGTWSRTPEQISFFPKEKIADYASLQKSIVHNALLSLASGGYFLYITCSVFQNENEELIDFVENNFSDLKKIKSDYLEGYFDKADTMFAVLFRKK